ncbi:unnamed protein product [Adineta steineri]|uniref:Cyclin-like domain-containing protein n=2 Tax=Adineta steineri TaxID=433720 RepID=A0A813ZU23_9BILA|nr:unnamed protein product [Adineta steineri]
MTEYGSVVLTLSNVLLPPEKLYPNPTPSTIEGLPWDVEYDLRLIGCELIQTACLLLKLPQTAVATGQVLFHRYFYFSSFVRRPMEIMAMACTNLAAKIEENARRVRDIINVFHHIKQSRSGSVFQPLLIDQVYIDRKNEVIKAERRLLKELGFCVYVKHPHKVIAMYLKILEKEREKDFVQTSWNYMNDSLRTDIFLRFPPETIACACIDLAARNLQIALPKNPPWYLIFGAKPEEIRYIMIQILRIYKHRPKPLDELEKIVNSIREKRENERRKFRPDFGNDSPAPQQTIQTNISSTGVSFSTPTNIQPEIASVIATTTTIVEEVTKVTSESLNGTTATTIIIKQHDSETLRESSTNNNNRHHHHHHHRRKRSTTPSRSSSRSYSRSPIHHSQKKKKTSHRSRSRSRSSSRRRHRHLKDKRHHSSGYTSSNHQKKDKKQRTQDDNYTSNNIKYSTSTKDANNNIHQRSHRQSSKETNGVPSSSSNRKIILK